MEYDIFDNMIEGVQIVDQDFRYVYVNDAVATHGKSSKQALLGTTMSESYPGIEKTEVFALIRAALEEGRYSQMINEFDFPDGSKGYFQLRIQPVPEGALILSFDVTDQRRAEIAMRDLNAMLEARVRERTALLEAKNGELEQIAYIASHDLQEPLRTIRSFIDILAEDCPDQLDEEARTSMGFIADAAKRMQGLIHALLDYSRLGRTQEREETDVGALMGEIQHDLRALADRMGAHIEVGPLPTLSVFPAELRQLLQNLVSNALKFSKPETPPEVSVHATEEPDRYVFRVADNGIGFDMRYADKVFYVFQRLHTRSAYEGTGIGLASCKKIVSHHGGEIWCESEPGAGSTFYFSIPRTHGPSEEAAP
jgi:PAS domain S-box-containing protein